MRLKMSDLKVNVPLAEDDTAFENDPEGGDGNPLDSVNNNLSSLCPTPHRRLGGAGEGNFSLSPPCSTRRPCRRKSASPNIEAFGDEMTSGSLEDLVTSFDEKISSCFKNFHESTEEIAPVQIRTQEEIMNECQIWWTLTGNFGNILPIDWSKSYTRSLQLNALNIKEDKSGDGSNTVVGPDGVTKAAPNTVDELSDDEELAQALDMHSLIMTYPPAHDVPLQTADQVIQEIDEMMQQSSTSEMTGSSDVTWDSAGEMNYSPTKARLKYLNLQEDPEFKAKFSEATSLTSSEDKLKVLSYSQLISLHGELENLIKVYNEALVEELALRDELEYEKELKNTFISLILNVQNKRRQYLLERKRKGLAAATRFLPNEDPGNHPQFVTAVIPYHVDSEAPTNAMLQSLIKGHYGLRPKH